MNTSENTRLDSTILNDPNAQTTIPPVPQPGAPVPPPIPSPEAFGTSSFDTASMGEAPMSYDTNGYPTSEPMGVQPTMNNDDSKRKKNVAAALAAGIGGIGIGAGAVLLSSFKKGGDEPEARKEEVGDFNTLADQTTDGNIPVAHSVTDDMSFSEAYAAARAEVGPGGAFSWHGQVYSTYTEAEWNAMSAQEQAAFNDHFTFFQDGGGHTPATPANTHNNHVADNHQTTPETPDKPVTGGDTPGGEKPVTSQFPYTVDVDGEKIEVLGVQQIDGQEVYSVRINGQEAVMLDRDNDGTFDYIAADLNGNGKLDPEQELLDLHQSGVKIEVAQLSPDHQHHEQPQPIPPALVSESQAIVVHDAETGQNLAIMQSEDGKMIYLVDDNGDRTFDYAWVDINGNGSAETDEVASLQEMGQVITVNDLGGFTSEEQLAQLRAEANSDVVVAQEVPAEEYGSEEDGSDDDVVVADPDDSTMPPVTDDDADRDITIVETEADEPAAQDDVTIVDPDDSTMPPVTDGYTGQNIVVEDSVSDMDDNNMDVNDTIAQDM